MKLLLGALPQAVEVAGEMVPLRWDFRAGLLFERLLSDDRAGDAAKVALGVRLYYAPEDLARGLAVEALFEAAVGFFLGGEAQEGRGGGERLYDWGLDAGAVYADFRAVYGVDLSKERLHWWAFRAMVEALPPESAFGRRVGVRAARLSDMPDGASRARLAELKKAVGRCGPSGPNAEAFGPMGGDSA